MSTVNVVLAQVAQKVCGPEQAGFIKGRSGIDDYVALDAEAAALRLCPSEDPAVILFDIKAAFPSLATAVILKAIGKAMNNEPSIDWLLKNQKKVGHYFHDLAKSGGL